ncbi:gamma-glutamyltransferase [Nitrincola alkalisediminis]|uniref:gamma-glutamyltransferase n=1 Tax=Nitrincola alkalisediminis TaxID=1366656 RepID=UPI0018738A27|nr:gamma-glutamyltransferase [Nitrincola alkalisediminis]
MPITSFSARFPFKTLALTGLLLSASGLVADTGLRYQIPIQPEAATGYQEKPGWKTKTFAVAAANPLATDAGYQIIKAGGSALDAAIAVQMVLTLVEPQSSGIGGGAFLMYFDGEQVLAYDGRETAPAAVTPELFLTESGEALGFMDAAASGLSVGVPGVLRMLEQAHKKHGKLPWAELFIPAITLAEQGFPISPRLQGLLANESALKLNPAAASFYYDAQQTPLPIGYQLQNPALAAIFKTLAEQGSDAFYTGEIASNLVEQVQQHPTYAGAISLDDMAAYEPIVREPICTDWKVYRVCGFPPPSSGHLTLMQILGILEQRPMMTPAYENELISVEWLHNFTEASRLSFADRALYLADPDFVPAPGNQWESLVSPDYLAQRANLIGESSMGRAEAGNPGAWEVSFVSMPDQPEYGTSHISIVDQQGHALAMTTTIEAAFGSRMLVDGGTGLAGGYLLNNELTDFSFQPTDEQGRLIANRVEPGKRPRSSMSPTLVFDRETGDFVASLGSPGGAAIIHYTARTLIAMLDWGLNAQDAISLPHALSFNGPTLLEAERFPDATRHALEAKGHEVVERDLTSGLQAIQKDESGYFSGADPRREGVVMGE